MILKKHYGAVTEIQSGQPGRAPMGFGKNIVGKMNLF